MRCATGASAAYKKKYGVREVDVRFFRRSRYRMAACVRNAANAAFRFRQAADGRTRSLVSRDRQPAGTSD